MGCTIFGRCIRDYNSSYFVSYSLADAMTTKNGPPSPDSEKN